MSLDDICQIGHIKASDENLQILSKYTQFIIPWLESAEFKANWANKPFPPLIDPKKMDYQGSAAEHAWLLNIPLPKYYDFVVFGAHASGLHSAIPAFLSLCGVTHRSMVIRDLAEHLQKEEHKGNKGNYIRIYNELVLANALKEKGDIKYAYLQLSDLVIDEDGVKFYSLIDASKALHVVKDPIEILKSIAATPHRLDHIGVSDSDELFKLGVFLDTDPKKFVKNHIYYINKDVKNSHADKPKMPDINSVQGWIADAAQNFHNALQFALLKDSLKVVKLKQTSDFIGEKCFDTMKEIAEHFGIDAPKDEDKWLFKKRVSDYKHFLPLSLYASKQAALFDGTNERKMNCDEKAYYFENISKEYIQDCVEFIITTRFDSLASKASDQDISELFELSDDVMCVLIRLKDAIKLLKNPALLQKAKEYIKTLSAAIKEQAEIENSKKFKVDDVLDFLKSNPKLALDLREVLEQDLSVLKANKPEIIENWSGYQRFLKLCKELENEVKKEAVETKPLMSNLNVSLALMDSRLHKNNF